VTDIVRILRPYLRHHRRLLLIAAGAMVGEVVTAILMPWPLKFVFDNVLFEKGAGGKPLLRQDLGGHGLLLLVLLSVAAIAIALFDALFSYVDDRTTEVVAQRSVFELRRDLFCHLQRLSVAFHQHLDTRVGDLLARLSGDIQALQDLASAGVSNLITNGLTLLAMLGVMLWIDWRLALLSAVLTTPLLVVARKTTLQMRLALRQARRQEGQVSAVLQESLTAIKLVQAYGREELEEARLQGASAKSLEASLEAAVLQARLNPSITVLSTIATVGVTLYGVFLVVGKSITPGDLLIFLGYLRGMQSPIRQLAKLSYQLGKATAGVERLNQVFAEVPQVVERPGAKEVRSVTGHIVFDHVSFGYSLARTVLDDVSLEASPGETVAIVGNTGAGKSTLVSLLPRFYDPTTGRVLIDGTDVRDLTLASLRAQIALVLQDSLIFRASVRENIAFGCPDASDDDIEAAAEAAGVGVIARRLPDGYDTVISERGTSLSGGEKQCIGIARAMLKAAPIVVLDEPTSSMDSFTERLVMDGLERLIEGRTTFVIAHRLATVRNADLVAVVQEGRLVETGTPAQLLAGDTIFAALARTQTLIDHRRPRSSVTRR
jgi:ATP-binding cassette subfamily B protein/subfamily B ATP-binding cassette protein MsbA